VSFDPGPVPLKMATLEDAQFDNDDIGIRDSL
jgi:hypothetical protein